MSFSIISVGDNQTAMLEIDQEAISTFFKNERKIFSGKLSELPAVTVKIIKAMVGKTEDLGFVHVFTAIKLAGERNRPDVLSFIQYCQEKYSSRYFVGK
ncbi:MAG: hypothetical protein PHE24_04550 [Patescibacteria group bacterium]|nr:hypothetical protein [Patescibacteria group bacterium]